MTKFRASLPQRFVDRTLDEIDDDPAKQGAVAQIRKWLEGHPPGQGILLFGPPGRGKTMFACMAANESGMESGFITIAGYQQLLHRVMHLSSIMQYDQDARDEWKLRTSWMHWLRSTLPLLIIDDLGKEHTTGSRHIEDELDFLLRYRYDRGLPTIATTNYQPDDFQEKYSLAMFSFIHEAFRLVPVLDIKDVRVAAGTKR